MIILIVWGTSMKQERKQVVMWIGSSREKLVTKNPSAKPEYIGYAKAILFFGSKSQRDAFAVLTQQRDERKREDTLLLLAFEKAIKACCKDSHYAIRIGVDSRRGNDFMNFFADNGAVREYLRTGKMFDLDKNPCAPDTCVVKNEYILRRIYDYLDEHDIVLRVQYGQNLMAAHTASIVDKRLREEKARREPT